MKITIKEKIDLLEKVRLSLLQDLDRCSFMKGICGYVEAYTGYSIKDSIPELLKHKPINAGMFWFDMDKAGHGKRIEIINKTLFDLESLQEKEIEKVYFKCKPENILLAKSHSFNTYYRYVNNLSLSFPVDFIKQNPDLFIIKTKEDLLNGSLNDKLYELQEFCKKRIPVKKNEWVNYAFVLRDNKIDIFYFTKKQLFLTGSNIKVKFDSEEQAILFLHYINLPENKELKNYFINTLKN